jgi:DNA-binding NtrC family response regulator
LNSTEKTTQLCGSSRDLAEEVKAWRIREDFYYLVSAVTLLIPPLRCRKPEILTIADDLLTQYSKQFDRLKPILCKEIVEHLMEHTWPGNLMELQAAITTFVAMGDTGANSKGATVANSTDTPQLRQLKNQIRAQRAGIAAARQEQARLQQKIRTYESRIESSPRSKKSINRLCATMRRQCSSTTRCWPR